MITVEKFQGHIRWDQFQQEEELAEKERKHQENTRKERNNGKLNEFLNNNHENNG